MRVGQGERLLSWGKSTGRKDLPFLSGRPVQGTVLAGPHVSGSLELHDVVRHACFSPI